MNNPIPFNHTGRHLLSGPLRERRLTRRGFWSRRKIIFKHSRLISLIRRWWSKGEKRKEKQEIPVSSETHDPLSMFARCYLKEDIHPGQSIAMSIFDG